MSKNTPSTIKTSAMTKYSSKGVIATMLPKRKLLKSEAFLTKPDKTPAKPIPMESVMAIWG